MMATLPKFRKPVSEITDRAKRYRANRVKKLAKFCENCGSRENLLIGHRDGNESNGAPYNLGTFCKSCNGIQAHEDKRAGRGVRTRQYNPPENVTAKLKKLDKLASRAALRGDTKAFQRYKRQILKLLETETSEKKNPGAINLAQYVQAAMEHVRGSHDAAGATLHETPKAIRREFAKEIWWRRGYRGNPPEDIMPEYWAGKLRDSHGLIVHDEKQAKAILLSELRALGKIGPRKNPDESDADKLYRKFHGVKADNHLVFDVPEIDPYGSHPELAQLGLLVRLVVGEGVDVKPSGNEEDEKIIAVEDDFWSTELVFLPDVAEYRRRAESTRSQADVDQLKSFMRKHGTPDVASEPNGKQLYIVGGNQNIDSKLGELGADSEKELIDCGFCYVIEYYTQKHFDRQRPIDYFHRLGEKSGVPPRLFYWRTAHLLQLVGGEYFVTARGIEN